MRKSAFSESQIVEAVKKGSRSQVGPRASSAKGRRSGQWVSVRATAPRRRHDACDRARPPAIGRGGRTVPPAVLFA